MPVTCPPGGVLPGTAWTGHISCSWRNEILPNQSRTFRVLVNTFYFITLSASRGRQIPPCGSPDVLVGSFGPSLSKWSSLTEIFPVNMMSWCFSRLLVWNRGLGHRQTWVLSAASSLLRQNRDVVCVVAGRRNRKDTSGHWCTLEKNTSFLFWWGPTTSPQSLHAEY